MGLPLEQLRRVFRRKQPQTSECLFNLRRLPLELQVRVASHLDLETLIMLVKALKGTKCELRAAIKHISKPRHLKKIIKARQKGSAYSKPWINVVDFKTSSKWDVNQLYAELKGTKSFVKFNVSHSKATTYTVELGNMLGSSVELFLTNLKRFRIQGHLFEQTTNITVISSKLNLLEFKYCDALCPLKFTYEPEGGAVLKKINLISCSRRFLNNLDIRLINPCETVKISGPNVVKLSPSTVTDKMLNLSIPSEKIVVESLYSMENCEVQCLTMELQWASMNVLNERGIPTMKNVTAKNLRTLLLTLKDTFPLITNITTPRLCRLYLSTVLETHQIDCENADFGFLNSLRSFSY